MKTLERSLHIRLRSVFLGYPLEIQSRSIFFDQHHIGVALQPGKRLDWDDNREGIQVIKGIVDISTSALQQPFDRTTLSGLELYPHPNLSLWRCCLGWRGK